MSDRAPLAGICAVWAGLAKKAEQHKYEAFGRTARECWKFFDSSHEFMYGNKGSTSKHRTPNEAIGMSTREDIPTSFRMTVNKVAELVQIFGPALYFQNPYRQVNPRLPEIPDLVGQMMQQQPPEVQQAMQMQQSMQAASKKAIATLMQWYLNYLPNELGLREESRMAIDEALIKGRGILWTELYSPPDSQMVMPRSCWDSVDNLLIDPDAEKLEDACWIMRKRMQPYYIVEERFGLKRDSLKKSAKLGETVTQQAFVEADSDNMPGRRRGDTQDLFCYYEVWSKCGLGQYLKNTLSETGSVFGDINKLRDTLDEFGRYCYLAVADGLEYPLNLSPEVMNLDVSPDTPEGQQNQAHVQDRVKWPVPFYLDAGCNGWPFTELDFHVVPRSVWPMAHMSPGLGELKFINWSMSFLAGRMRTTSRTFIGMLESLDEEVKNAILNGGDLTVIPLKGILNKSVSDCVQFLNHPNVISDMWTIVDRVMAMFDKRVGLTELMYGMTESQMRSAAEADVKSSQINIRPGDMAECTETWQSRVARKEALIARLFVGPQDVAPVLGEPIGQMQIGPLTQLWSQLVYKPATDAVGVSGVIREFDYRIEAGSIRKPNRSRDQSNMNEAIKTWAPVIEGHYQQTGDPTQLNALLNKWAKTFDLDVSDMQFQPPPAPPAPAQPQPQQAA